MRVVLGEDLTLLRDGLIRLLTAYDMDVVAAVDSGPELLRALVHHRPDVAVVDVRLPPTFTDEGLRAAIQARTQLPGLPVLVLSQHVEQLYAKELLSAGTGGLGYLLKDRVSDVLRFIEAVRTVAGGGNAMDPEVVSQLLARRGRDEQLGRLTSREREVLALMAEGHSNAGIASRLVVTEKAVNKHIGNIFTKLGLYPAEDANRRVLAVLTYLNALSCAVYDLTGGVGLAGSRPPPVPRVMQNAHTWTGLVPIRIESTLARTVVSACVVPGRRVQLSALRHRGVIAASPRPRPTPPARQSAPASADRSENISRGRRFCPGEAVSLVNNRRRLRAGVRAPDNTGDSPG